MQNRKRSDWTGWIFWLAGCGWLMLLGEARLIMPIALMLVAYKLWND